MSAGFPPCHVHSFFVFFFNDTATTELYTLSLHDALPISQRHAVQARGQIAPADARDVVLERVRQLVADDVVGLGERSEEHTSELQSLTNLVCRLLLEKKKHQRQAISLGINISQH